MERVQDIGWTAYHLDDLDADFLRFYGRDWRELDGPRFFALAERVGAYGGVISYRISEQHEGAEDEGADDLSDLPDLVEVG